MAAKPRLFIALASRPTSSRLASFALERTEDRTRISRAASAPPAARARRPHRRGRRAAQCEAGPRPHPDFGKPLDRTTGGRSTTRRTPKLSALVRRIPRSRGNRRPDKLNAFPTNGGRGVRRAPGPPCTGSSLSFGSSCLSSTLPFQPVRALLEAPSLGAYAALFFSAIPAFPPSSGPARLLGSCSLRPISGQFRIPRNHPKAGWLVALCDEDLFRRKCRGHIHTCTCAAVFPFPVVGIHHTLWAHRGQAFGASPR